MDSPARAAKKPVLDKLAAEGCCGSWIPSLPVSARVPIPPTSPCSATIPTNTIPAGARSSARHRHPYGAGHDRLQVQLARSQRKASSRTGGRQNPPHGRRSAKRFRKGVDLSDTGLSSPSGREQDTGSACIKGEGIGHCVSSNDPKKEGVPREITEIRQTPADRMTADICNDFVKQSTRISSTTPSRERLKKGLNPAHIVLMRGAGEREH